MLVNATTTYPVLSVLKHAEERNADTCHTPCVQLAASQRELQAVQRQRDQAERALTAEKQRAAHLELMRAMRSRPSSPQRLNDGASAAEAQELRQQVGRKGLASSE